jgi:hypothetical protein
MQRHKDDVDDYYIVFYPSPMQLLLLLLLPPQLPVERVNAACPVVSPPPCSSSLCEKEREVAPPSNSMETLHSLLPKLRFEFKCQVGWEIRLFFASIDLLAVFSFLSAAYYFSQAWLARYNDCCYSPFIPFQTL